MKALSIRQPWAWLIVNGHKDIENRSWTSKHRGEFLIHAGKKIDTDGYAYVLSEFPDIALPAITEFQCGGIVGKATMTDCVAEHDSRWKDPDSNGFVLTDQTPIQFKPLKGQLTFFNVEDDIMKKIYIPKRSKLEETACPLPEIYQKACKKIMHRDGWNCEDKCWRNILAAMVTLGSKTFVVDTKVTDFDYSTLERKSKPKPQSKTAPKKDLFDGWKQ